MPQYLEIAACQSDVEMLKTLSKYGADANLQDSTFKMSALHHVAQKYNTKSGNKSYIKD